MSIPAHARYYPMLDAMRGLAAIAVALYHVTLYSPLLFFPLGNLAVDLFFCLSGFVLFSAYHDDIMNGMSFGEWLKIRLARLCPMQVIGILLGAGSLTLLFALHRSNVDYEAILISVGLNIFYLPYLHGGSKIGGTELHAAFMLNPALWSLSFEMLLSVLFFHWAKLEGKLLRVWWIACAILFVLLFSPYSGAMQNTFFLGITRCLYPFLSGMIIARYGESFFKKIRPLPFALIALITLAPYVFYSSAVQYYWVYVLLIAPFTVGLGAYCLGELSPSMLAAAKYLGKLSYPLYCVHWAILLLFIGFSDLQQRAAKKILTMPMALCALAMIAIISHLCALYLEPAFRRWMRNKLGLHARPKA